MKSLTSVKLTFFITLLAVGYAGMVAAQSQGPSRLTELADAEGCEFPEMPDVPEADGATMEQMVATQGAVQAYIEESNALLECLEGITGNEDLPAEDRQTALDGYNAEVASQEALAERWSVERTGLLELEQQSARAGRC